VVQFFRYCLVYIAERKIEHFHTVVTPTRIHTTVPSSTSTSSSSSLPKEDSKSQLNGSSSNGFVLTVHYQSKPKKRPPAPRQLCISCNIENEVSKCSLLKQTNCNRLWIDAKGCTYTNTEGREMATLTITCSSMK
jgi:hypothetical protein